MDATAVGPTTTSNQNGRRMVLLSPIVVVGLGYVVASVTGAIWGLWAWVPVLAYYWAVLGALIAWGVVAVKPCGAGCSRHRARGCGCGVRFL